MKSFSKVVFYMMSISLMMLASSCKKNFLEEDLTTAHGLDYYKTDQGIAELVVGAYNQVMDVPMA
ncbi:MAG TPA: hypothetical protein VFX43_00465, partial [Chitinophagaceae bacterium]|nr:hypothetical protein [Chitinophagaceae bacterium]